MQPCPGGPGFQLCSIGIGIYEAEKLGAVSATLPFPGEGVQALESPMGHRNSHLPGDALVGTLLLHLSPSRGGGRGAGEPWDCGGPACPVPVGAAPLVAAGAGRHGGSGTGLTCSIVLIPWGNTSWTQYWTQQSSAHLIHLQKAPDSAFKKIVKELSCFRVEKKKVCHVPETG